MLDFRYVDIVELDHQPSLEWHPIADIQLRTPADGFEALKADIAANGLINPPTLYEGKILDGRDRCQACAELDIPITRFGVYDGDDPVGFVIRQNTLRRHATVGARAMETALLLQKGGRRKNGRWTRGSIVIAKSANKSAWQTALHKAGVILDYGGHVLADLVVTDQWALDKAYQHADDLRRVKPERTAETKAKYAAALRAFSECEAEYHAKGDELEQLGAALAAACADAVGDEQKTRARAKKSAGSESPVTARAKAIGVLASYGRAGDPDAEGFDPNDVDPPMLADNFEAAVLADAMAGVQKLIDWRVRYDARAAA